MLYLYGASGHAKVIIEIAEQQGFVIGGLIDANPAIKELLGYPVMQELPEPANDYSGATFIVSVGNNAIRKRITQELETTMKKVFFETLAHPHASISARTHIGAGTVIMAGVSINSEATIGNHCIINTNASIDHDCHLEDFVHISPGVSLAGNVHIGEQTHIGIGTCVIQGIRIGRNCTIGAGTVVIRDIPDGMTVVGNPGRVLDK